MVSKENPLWKSSRLSDRKKAPSSKLLVMIWHQFLETFGSAGVTFVPSKYELLILLFVWYTLILICF